MFVESNTFKNGLILWFFNFIFSTSLYCISQKYWILTNQKLERKKHLALFHRQEAPCACVSVKTHSEKWNWTEATLKNVNKFNHKTGNLKEKELLQKGKKENSLQTGQRQPLTIN